MNVKSLIIVFVVFVACNQGGEKQEVWKGFNPTDLENAWTKGDNSVVIKWISSLSDTVLDDGEFYSRVSYLSNVTGFCYGNADPSEKSFWEMPKTKREAVKKNVAKVYELYRQSCLFMQKTSWDETLPLQDRYWNDSTELEPEKLKLISQAIDSLCKQ
mgnify:FL=1